MKEIHLIANAHIDPIWQWEWNEGIAAAIATFRSAADIVDEFDYVFCHNDSSLYKYIEKYSPALFKRIKKLVREGKWKIIGGWYTQPDCNMPQGESIVRQIMTARRYFIDKFGYTSTAGFNVDSFGHSVGLPQILKKCGQDAYLCTRCGLDEYTPGSQFLWESPDGSQVKVNGTWHGYSSGYDKVTEKITNVSNFFSELDTICILWGVGNHGGGPSRQNLIEIEEMRKKGELKIIHSDTDTFFARLDPTAVHKKSMRTVMPGCYTSISALKQRHAALENALFFAEKICSVASMRGLMEYPEEKLDEACEDLLKLEFHDSLPGTVTKPATEQSLRIADHGITICEEMRDLAYFLLTSQHKKAADGENPFLVFNPQAYELESEITVEMSLAEQNWDQSKPSRITVRDEDGNILKSQIVKENSNLNVDWRKKIIFRGKLKPLDLTRFSIYVDFVPSTEKEAREDGDIVVDTGKMHVEISKTTGLMRSFAVDGVERLSREAFCPIMFEDTADPWGMAPEQLKGMGTNPVRFKLMEKPSGIFEGMAPVQLIEDGEIYTGVEAFFECGRTLARVEYDIYKNNSCVDVKVDVFSAEIDKMIKLELPYALEGDYIGQIAYGTERLNMDGRECVAQRFVAIDSDGDALALLNKGTHGSSITDGAIHMSLLRNAVFCAHPIDDRPLLREGIYSPRIDMGVSSFEFRLCAAKTSELERLTAEFNTPPFAVNVYPVEDDEKAPEVHISIDDRDVVLTAMVKVHGEERKYALRLFNNSSIKRNAALSVNDKKIALDFGVYEVKTVLCDGENLEESYMMLV